MKTLKGKDLVFTFGDKRFLHAQTHEVNSTANFEEWETKDTDGVQYELTSITGTASANGIACYKDAEDGENLDTEALFDAHLAGEKGTLLLTIGTAQYKGDAWITDVQASGENSKLATASASFKFNKLKKVEAETAQAATTETDEE